MSNVEHKTVSKYPSGVCTFQVGASCILCTSCDLWIHNKFQVKLIALLTTKTLRTINVPEKLYLLILHLSKGVRLSEVKCDW